jgi:hypothetical protein
MSRYLAVHRESAHGHSVDRFVLAMRNGWLARIDEEAGVVPVRRVYRHAVAELAHEPLGDLLEEVFSPSPGREVTLDHV